MGRYDILLTTEARPAPRTPRVGDQPSNPPAVPHRAADDVQTPDRPIERSPARSTSRAPGRRTLGRVAFEFYLDQVDALRSRSLEQKLRGEKGSMSEMVREAIDQYLAKYPKS